MGTLELRYTTLLGGINRLYTAEEKNNEHISLETIQLKQREKKGMHTHTNSKQRSVGHC